MLSYLYKPCPKCCGLDLTVKEVRVCIDPNDVEGKIIPGLFCGTCGVGAPLEIWNALEREVVMPPKRENEEVDEETILEEEEAVESEEVGEGADVSDIDM